MMESSIEPVPFDFGVDQGPDQVIGLLVPGALLGHGGDVLGVLHGGHHGLVRRPGVGGAERLQHVVGPTEEVVAVLGGHPQHVADDDHGQGGGDVPDEVGRPGLAHPVDDPVAYGPDALLALPDPPRGEALADQPAATEVLGGVGLDHHREGEPVGPDPAGVGESVGVLRDLPYVGVAGDAPHPRGLVEVGRGVVPHPGEGREGITGVERAVGQSDAQPGGRCGHGTLSPWSRARHGGATGGTAPGRPVGDPVPGRSIGP